MTTVTTKKTITEEVLEITGFTCNRCGKAIGIATYRGPDQGMVVHLAGGYGAFADADFSGHLCEACMSSFCEWLGPEGLSLLESAQ
jgi:hypothetical protein